MHFPQLRTDASTSLMVKSTLVPKVFRVSSFISTTSSSSVTSPSSQSSFSSTSIPLSSPPSSTTTTPAVTIPAGSPRLRSSPPSLQMLQLLDESFRNEVIVLPMGTGQVEKECVIM